MIDALLAQIASGNLVTLTEKAVMDWAFVEAALIKEQRRTKLAGAMFPQLDEEHRRSDKAFDRVLECVRWAKKNNMPLPAPPTSTNTPLTDKEAFSDSLMPELQNVPVEFARRLEKERGELMGALIEYLEYRLILE